MADPLADKIEEVIDAFHGMSGGPRWSRQRARELLAEVAAVRGAEHPRSIPSAPQCKECGCTTGGGSYCFEHAPYTVWPLKDGSWYEDRSGQRRRVSVEPIPPNTEARAADAGPVSRSQKMHEDEDLSRVERQPLAAHGDLPRPATGPSEGS